jgi:hypothetical protein
VLVYSLDYGLEAEGIMVGAPYRNRHFFFSTASRLIQMPAAGSFLHGKRSGVDVRNTWSFVSTFYMSLWRCALLRVKTVFALDDNTSRIKIQLKLLLSYLHYRSCLELNRESVSRLERIGELENRLLGWSGRRMKNVRKAESSAVRLRRR